MASRGLRWRPPRTASTSAVSTAAPRRSWLHQLRRDHLDHHATTEAYAAAKIRLFDTLMPSDAPAIINADGPMRTSVPAGRARSRPEAFHHRQHGRDLAPIEARAEGFSQVLTVEAFGKTIRTTLPLLGAFQVENALLAAGLVLAIEGEGRQQRCWRVSRTSRASGRLEQVGDVDGAICIVDYAHKPDALAHVLDALRPFVKGKLYSSAEGHSGSGKRPLMGRIAHDMGGCGHRHGR